MTTETDKLEAERLLEAQRNLDQKRAVTTVQVAPVKETLEQQCARIQQKFVAAPIAPERRVDVTVRQALDLREAAGIPQRHRIEIPDGQTLWHAELAKMVRLLGNGFIVGLTGVQGTGKTQMASALIYAATTRLMSCKYSTAMDFFMALKNTFTDGAKQSEAQVIASFVKPKLLALDEMDERSESAWENRLLFHMINQRYNNLVDTVLISRKSASEFSGSLGDSVTSRIQETGGAITCDWASFREKK